MAGIREWIDMFNRYQLLITICRLFYLRLISIMVISRRKYILYQ